MGSSRRRIPNPPHDYDEPRGGSTFFPHFTLYVIAYGTDHMIRGLFRVAASRTEHMRQRLSISGVTSLEPAGTVECRTVPSPVHRLTKVSDGPSRSRLVEFENIGWGEGRLPLGAAASALTVAEADDSPGSLAVEDRLRIRDGNVRGLFFG